MDWAQLTVSDGHFLDEITATLRDAHIELRLTDPVELPQRGARTRFGQQATKAKVIEVPRADLAQAQALMQEIFSNAEEAALRESGAAPPDAKEQEEELAWRAEVDRKRARSDARFRWGMRGFVLLAAVAIVAVLIGEIFH